MSPPKAKDLLFRKVLANEAIEQVLEGPLKRLHHLGVGKPYHFKPRHRPAEQHSGRVAALEKLSRDGLLALNRAEMPTIQQHFRDLGRDPTDIELETLAQTWSEHCSHKNLMKGQIDFLEGKARIGQQSAERKPSSARRKRSSPSPASEPQIEVRQRFRGQCRHRSFRRGIPCLLQGRNAQSSVGHRAIRGCQHGLGRRHPRSDGRGLDAKPICNTDVFCFRPPDTPPVSLPPGVLHPLKVMKGVVAGVRDYGNRMGIPTVNGAVCFDERYLANPLVYCGTVGLIPVHHCTKAAKSGDLDQQVAAGRSRTAGATASTAPRFRLQDRADGPLGAGQQRRRRADRATPSPRSKLLGRLAASFSATPGCITPSPTAGPAASVPPSARWARNWARSCISNALR